VLIGSCEQRVMASGHDELSTHGILSDSKKSITRDWIEQLVTQDYIKKTGEYNVLKVTEKGWRLLKGEETPRLLRPAKKHVKVPKPAKDSWENVNRGLFEVLRNLRREIANKKGVPAYIVFSDVTLRDMARRKPSTPDEFLKVSGVGLKKEEQYGTVFLNAIKTYCLENSIEIEKG